MEEGRKVDVMEADEGRGGTGDEDAQLVEEGVGGIEVAEVGEG